MSWLRRKTARTQRLLAEYSHMIDIPFSVGVILGIFTTGGDKLQQWSLIHTLFLFLCHRFSSSYIFVSSVSALIAKVRSAPGVVVLLAEKVAQSPLCFINVYNPKLLFCLRDQRHIEKSFSDFFTQRIVFSECMNKVLPNSRMAVPVKSVRLTQWKNRKRGGC